MAGLGMAFRLGKVESRYLAVALQLDVLESLCHWFDFCVVWLEVFPLMEDPLLPLVDFGVVPLKMSSSPLTGGSGFAVYLTGVGSVSYFQVNQIKR